MSLTRTKYLEHTILGALGAAQVTILQTTLGTVPGTVRGAIRRGVCNAVMIAVGGAILTGTCGTRREGIRSPARTAIPTVTSRTTGNAIGRVTGEVSQIAIREETCGKILGATYTAIPLVVLRAPVAARHQHQQKRAAVVRRLVVSCRSSASRS